MARGVWFWISLVPQVPGLTWPWLDSERRRAFRDAFTLCVLAVVVARQGRPGAPDAGGLVPSGRSPEPARAPATPF